MKANTQTAYLSFFFPWLLCGNIFNHFCPLRYLKQFLLYDGKCHLSAVKRVYVPCTVKTVPHMEGQ